MMDNPLYSPSTDISPRHAISTLSTTCVLFFFFLFFFTSPVYLHRVLAIGVTDSFLVFLGAMTLQVFPHFFLGFRSLSLFLLGLERLEDVSPPSYDYTLASVRGPLFLFRVDYPEPSQSDGVWLYFRETEYLFATGQN